MKGLKESHIIQLDFYSFYKETYAPIFMEIDIALKAMENPLRSAEVADLLHISITKVEEIMSRENIEILDKNGFIALMRLGEGGVCRLYQRELERGLKPAYSPSDIAYIYGLDEGHVKAVSARLGQAEWLACDIPELLAQIPIFLVY